MRFIKCDESQAVEIVAKTISNQLQTQPVLFLVSGGSNINLSCQIINHLKNKKNLSLGLTDERFGATGHADSNWQQLLDCGLQTKDIKIYPVLKNLPFIDTSTNYNFLLKTAFKNNFVMGLFGMGTDGHTAGILPGSPVISSEKVVDHYEGGDFKRITTTPESFKQLDVAFLAARGQAKKAMLEKLQSTVRDDIQPAQALKRAKKLIILSDQLDIGA